MNNEPDIAATPAAARALAACGPECRYATRLTDPRFGDYIWCSRTGGPRSTGRFAADCPWYNPRKTLEPIPEGEPGRNGVGETPTPN